MFNPNADANTCPISPDIDKTHVLPRAGAWRANTIKKLSVLAVYVTIAAVSLIAIMVWNPFNVVLPLSHVTQQPVATSGPDGHGIAGSSSDDDSGSTSTSGGNGGQITTMMVMLRDAMDYNPYDPVDRSSGSNKMKYKWPYEPVKLLEDGQVGPNGKFVDTNMLDLDSLKDDELYDLSEFNCNDSDSSRCLGATEWYMNLPEKTDNDCGFRSDSDGYKYKCLVDGDYVVDTGLPPAYVLYRVVSPTVVEIARADNLDHHITGKPVTVHLTLIDSVPESSVWHDVIVDTIKNTCEDKTSVIFDVDDANQYVKLDNGRSVLNGILYCYERGVFGGYNGHININRNLVMFGAAVIDPDQCSTSEFAAEYWVRKAGCGGGPAQ